MHRNEVIFETVFPTRRHMRNKWRQSAPKQIRSKLIMFTFTSEVSRAQTQGDREVTETEIVYHFMTKTYMVSIHCVSKR